MQVKDRELDDPEGDFTAANWLDLENPKLLGEELARPLAASTLNAAVNDQGGEAAPDGSSPNLFKGLLEQTRRDCENIRALCERQQAHASQLREAAVTMQLRVLGMRLLNEDAMANRASADVYDSYHCGKRT